MDVSALRSPLLLSSGRSALRSTVNACDRTFCPALTVIALSGRSALRSTVNACDRNFTNSTIENSLSKFRCLLSKYKTPLGAGFCKRVKAWVRLYKEDNAAASIFLCIIRQN